MDDWSMANYGLCTGLFDYDMIMNNSGNVVLK